MSELNGALKIAAKGTLLVLLGLILSKVFAYIFRIIVAKVGVNVYGLVSLSIAVLAVLANLALLGTHFGLHRYVSFYSAREDRQHVKGTIFSAIHIGLLLSVLFAILLFIFSEQLAVDVFGNKELIPLFKLISLAIPFLTLSNQFLFSLQAFKEFEYSSFIKWILEGVLKVVFVVVFIALGSYLLGPIYAILFSLIIVAAVLFWLLNRCFPLFSKIKAKFNYKELISYSWPLALTAILIIFIRSMDTIIIGLLKPISDVGIYNAAVPTSHLIRTYSMAIGFIFLPIITTFYSKKKFKELNQVSKSVFKWNLMLTLPTLIFLIFFSRQVIHVLFGPEYLAAVPSLVVLLFGYFFFSWLLVGTEILKMGKKTRLIMYVSLFVAILNIILNFLLIRAYGIIGAAIATTISLIIYSVVLYLHAKKIAKLEVLTISNAKIIIAGFLAGLVLLVFNQLYSLTRDLTSVILLISITLVFIGIYLVLLLLLKTFDKYDTEVIYSIENKLGIKLRFLEKLLMKRS